MSLSSHTASLRRRRPVTAEEEEGEDNEEMVDFPMQKVGVAGGCGLYSVYSQTDATCKINIHKVKSTLMKLCHACRFPEIFIIDMHVHVHVHTCIGSTPNT